MNTHLFSDPWFASVQQTIQNASDSRAALHEAVRAISEQVDAIASMGLEYTWIESPRELVKVLSGDAADKDNQACWSWVGEIMDLHARSESLDDASFAKKVEVALQSSHQDQLSKGSPNEHGLAKTLMGVVAFVQGWAMGYAEN